MLADSVRSLDRLLRTATNRRRRSDTDSLAFSGEFSIATMLAILIALAMLYGLCMGSYSLFKPLNPEFASHGDRWMQVLASMVKVPLLYALTIVVTFPSLYVFSALVDSQLHFDAFVRLMITLLAINLAVLASLGPIVAFFSVSTINYRFMQLFNVLMFAIAGGLGLAWLLQRIRQLSARVLAADNELPSDAGQSADHDAPTDAADMPAKLIFRIWIVAFCLVGSQLGWVLRPFIGNPDLAFSWFRPRESNIFLALIDILLGLTGS